MSGAAARPALAVTERQLHDAVTELLTRLGYRWYHTHDSRRSNPGFPDLIAVKDGRMLAVELKARTGRLRPEQAEWLDALRGVPGVEAWIFWPEDWHDGTVEAVLRRDERS